MSPKPARKSAQQGNAETKLRAFHEESAIGNVVDFRLLKRLFPYLGPQRSYLIISLVMLVALSLLGLVRPLIMGRIVDEARLGNPTSLFHYGLTLAAVVVVLQTASFGQQYMLQIAGARAMAALRADVFRLLQRVSLQYFDRTPVGRLVTRATSDVDAVGELFASGVLNAVGDLVSLFGIVAIMLYLDWQLSLIAFAALPVVGLVTNFVRKRSREAFRDIRAKTARLNAFLNEQITGIAIVQAYAREEATAVEFDEINEAYRQANKKAILYEAVLDAAIEMVGTVCIASILFWAGVDRVGNRHIQFSLVVVFTQYIKQFFEPVSMLASRYTMLQSALAGAERVMGFFDQAELEPGALNVAEMGGDDHEALALDHVTFSYKAGRPVLDDVSLVLPKGSKVAFVGATGAGKTTVTSLALRLYEATEGSVRVMGKDVKNYEPKELRAQFSVVPQDVFLFSGTVLSNLTLNSGDVTPAEAKRAEEALIRVGGEGILNDRGLDARVDERGQNFSAGERQLIAFARALYRDAPILILDEATASIDSDTEAKLQKALFEVMAGRTAIVVAHRLSTIRAMDTICVFHRGQLVEQGSHDQLLAKGGVYAKLHRLQLASEAREAVDAPGVAEPVDAPGVAEPVDAPDVAEPVDAPGVAEPVDPPVEA